LWINIGRKICLQIEYNREREVNMIFQGGSRCPFNGVICNFDGSEGVFLFVY
jgi:hypothetical protein